MCKKQPPQESFYGYYGTGGDYDTTGGYYGRLWRICTTDGQADLMDIRHTWDAGGNLDTREDILESEIELFNYDFLDRLTSVSGAYSAGYTYDEIGNIVTRNGVSYTYDSTQPHAVDSVGGTSYYYDSNGNMTTRGGQTITWDQENMPVSVSGNGTTTTFVYDGDGNRVKKTEGGETTLYINRYYEKNLTTGNITTHYYLGGRLVAQLEGTTLRYIHQDHLTDTALTTSDNGTSLGTIKYYPYGSTRSGEVPTDKKFTGQRLDGTGLYYYNARYYDASIGRFISPDTIVPSPTNPQSFNRYSYCINNPTSAIDPNGLDYIFVGGSGSKWTEQWWIDILKKLNWNPAEEKVLFIADPNPGLPFEVSDQTQTLTNALAIGEYKDIKIIGHSEGAASTINILSSLARDDKFLAGTNVRSELKAAIMLDNITGISSIVVSGWDCGFYTDLPYDLAQEAPQAKLLDVWNRASIVHASGPMSGWGGENTYSYDSRSWYHRAWLYMNPQFMLLDASLGTWASYHNDPRTNPKVIDQIKNTIGS